MTGIRVIIGRGLISIYHIIFAYLLSVCPVPFKIPSAFFRYRACTTCRQTRVVHGGDDQIRTGDPLVANEVLSQLSYIPTFVLNIQRLAAFWQDKNSTHFFLLFSFSS